MIHQDYQKLRDSIDYVKSSLSKIAKSRLRGYKMPHFPKIEEPSEVKGFMDAFE